MIRIYLFIHDHCNNCIIVWIVILSHTHDSPTKSNLCAKRRCIEELWNFDCFITTPDKQTRPIVLLLTTSERISDWYHTEATNRHSKLINIPAIIPVPTEALNWHSKLINIPANIPAPTEALNWHSKLINIPAIIPVPTEALNWHSKLINIPAIIPALCLLRTIEEWIYLSYLLTSVRGASVWNEKRTLQLEIILIPSFQSTMD